MRAAGDEEVTGAATALLGLHSSSRPPPAPTSRAALAPSPRDPWPPSGTFVFSPGIQQTTRAGDGANSDASCSYPFYPKAGSAMAPSIYDVTPRADSFMDANSLAKRGNFLSGSDEWIKGRHLTPLAPDPRRILNLAPHEASWASTIPSPRSLLPRYTAEENDCGSSNHGATALMTGPTPARIEKHSLDDLLRLIPGAPKDDGDRPMSEVFDAFNRRHVSDGSRESRGRRYRASSALECEKVSTASSLWYTPDVHRPLSDMSRLHRARALARLRARRRSSHAAAAATAAVSACSKFSSSNLPASTQSSNTARRVTNFAPFNARVSISNSAQRTTPAESSPSRHRSTEQNSSEIDTNGVVTEVEDETKVTNMKNGEISKVSDTSKHNNTTADTEQKSCEHDVTESASGADTPVDIPPESRMGDLLELMRTVTANAAATACAAEGRVRENGELAGSREVGRPVKYKYRQEAARSRKRTRGRFVSEKAPAFVSITELMALRRAKRERQQQQQEAAPMFISAA